MVKEYDISQKGAEWTSFIRIAANAHPECTQSHIPGEKVFDKGNDWIGYFEGVKEDFVFLGAADGDNGGIQFAVYDSRTGKKVFEDTDCLRCMYLKKTYEKEPPLCSLQPGCGSAKSQGDRLRSSTCAWSKRIVISVPTRLLVGTM